jgi:hypothetical protein
MIWAPGVEEGDRAERGVGDGTGNGYLRACPVRRQWGLTEARGFDGVDVLIHELAGFAVWLVANGVYVDLRRKGEKGFARLVCFWLGLPVTWLSLLVVKEGSQPRIRPPPDDVLSLMQEIQRDRALRAGDSADQEPDESSEEET